MSDVTQDISNKELKGHTYIFKKWIKPLQNKPKKIYCKAHYNHNHNLKTEDRSILKAAREKWHNTVGKGIWITINIFKIRKASLIEFSLPSAGTPPSCPLETSTCCFLTCTLVGNLNGGQSQDCYPGSTTSDTGCILIAVPNILHGMTRNFSLEAIEVKK